MEKRLSQLIAENKVIPFVGAGVSKDVKTDNGEAIFLNWKELLESFIDVITDEKKKNIICALLDDEPIDYLDVADRIEKVLSTSEFNENLKNKFNVDYNNIDNETYNLAKSIWALNSKLIITTNYDKVLYHACDDKNIESWNIESKHEQAKFLKDGLSNPVVWNLHGDITQVDSLILTSKRYEEFYTEDAKESKYKTALETLRAILSTKRLLFIGFSLDDEYIVNQINRTLDIFDGNSSEHYFLLKKGSSSTPNLLNNKIKIIEFDDYGEKLIEKINSLKSLADSTSTKSKTNPTQILNLEEKDVFISLTTLPAINKEFVGRKDELLEIEKKLNNDSLTYIVNGIGGIGKSEVSSQYLHENKHKYKNIAFIEMTKDTTSLEELFIAKFKNSLYLEDKDTFDTVIQRLQNLPKKNLLLLDNLENKDDFEKIKALNINFDLLITTRITDIDVKNQLNLDTLNDEDAEDLFISIYNKDGNIKDILEYLDNHPLFITLTAKSLNKEYLTLEELRLNIKNQTISKIDSTDDKTFKQHLQNTFNKQFLSVKNEELKELLQVLAIFPSIEINYEILEKCINKKRLKINLLKLVEQGWLSKKDNTYKLHQIIKTFILEEYKLEYNDITFIFENIAKYIDPEDSTLIANKLNKYIPIIESFLSLFTEKEDEYICGILDSLTYLFYSLGQYNKALKYQYISFDIREEIYDEKSKFIAKSQNLLSILYQDMGNLKKALEYQEKSLKLREEILGDKNPDLSTSYNNISMIYQDMGNLKEALEYQEKSLKLTEELLGEKHPDLATSYNNISMIYKDMRNLKKALEYQEKSLKLSEEILDEKHPNLAASYNNISLIYQDMGNLKKALEYQEKSFKLTEELLGKKHPDLAISYNNISLINQGMGNLKKALEYQKKSFKLREEILGEKHPALATSYSNISMIYKDLKECEKVKEYIQKAINIWESTDYYKKEIFDAKYILKKVNINIKKEQKLNFNKKGRFCKD